MKSEKIIADGIDFLFKELERRKAKGKVWGGIYL